MGEHFTTTIERLAKRVSVLEGRITKLEKELRSVNKNETV